MTPLALNIITAVLGVAAVVGFGFLALALWSGAVKRRTDKWAKGYDTLAKEEAYTKTEATRAADDVKAIRASVTPITKNDQQGA